MKNSREKKALINAIVGTAIFSIGVFCLIMAIILDKTYLAFGSAFLIGLEIIHFEIADTLLYKYIIYLNDNKESEE